MEGDHWNDQRMRKPAIARRPAKKYIAHPAKKHLVWHNERIAEKPSRRARLKATLIRVWTFVCGDVG